jgi:hypothetical protein
MLLPVRFSLEPGTKKPWREARVKVSFTPGISLFLARGALQGDEGLSGRYSGFKFRVYFPEPITVARQR